MTKEIRRTIHKYVVDHPDVNQYDMACHGKVIRVAYDENKLCFWVLFDTSDFIIRREFCIVMTGEEIPPDREYLGTVMNYHGFVFHLFERVNLT